MDLQQARRYSRRLPNLVFDGDYFQFIGGLNLVDTPLSVKPGQMMACKNYEPATRGGYERTRGFERFDGRLKPSAAAYYILEFNTGIPAQYPLPNDTITGLTSGATAIALAEPFHAGGAGYLVIGRISGTFEDGEGLQAAGTQFGLADGVPVINNAINDDLDASYRALAVADARAQIGAIPGSGPIRGVGVYNGNGYAVRDNEAGTAGILWKSSTSGWTQVALGHLLRFDAGTSEPVPGETLSGATAINITSGGFQPRVTATY